MVDPDPLLAPVAPDWVTVHANVVLDVVPGTVDESEILGPFPEQTLVGDGLATTLGNGFTVTVTEVRDETQPGLVLSSAST